MVDDYEHRMRIAAMAWLDGLLAGDSEVVRYEDIAGFTFGGRRIPLMDPQRGIRKSAGLEAAFSIRTRFTRPGYVPPYEDAEAQMACSGTSTGAVRRGCGCSGTSLARRAVVPQRGPANPQQRNCSSVQARAE